MTALYAMEKQALEAFFASRASLSTEQVRLVSESGLFAFSEPPAPGSAEAVSEIYSLDEASGAARIAITGVLSAAGPSVVDRILGIEGTSYRTVRAACKRAASDGRAKSVILDIDSPGGDIAGLDETWQAVRALNGEKPVSVSGGSMVASAAYWLAVAAAEILASSASSLFGSVGVIAAFYDDTAALEQWGYKKITLVSKNAPNKDALKPDGEYAEIRQRLDALERIFYDRIARGRGVTAEHIAENFGRGGLLVAEDPGREHNDALRSGMIDGLVSGRSGTPAAQTGAAENVSNQAGSGESAVEITPAQAGTAATPKENYMTLQELLAANPAAKAEHDALCVRSKQAGRDEAKAELQSVAERCAAFIASESYPATVRKMAAEVVAGKKTMAALEAVVAYADMEAEKAKSDAAKSESGSIVPPVPPAPSNLSAEEQALHAAQEAAIAAERKRKESVTW